MATRLFRSPLAFRLQTFLETHKNVRSRQSKLYYSLTDLDDFLATELRPGQPLTQKLVERWMATMSHLSVGTRGNRMSVLRQFCRYLSYFDSRTCIVHRSFLPHRTRPAPYIYSRDDVRKIMSAARRLGPKGSFRPVVIASVVGLLYATGIRIGEALKLRVGDVDFKRRLLVIREGKFRKSRYVPLSSSAVRQLKVYHRRRQRSSVRLTSSSPFFVGRKEAHMDHVTFSKAFLEVARRIKLRGPPGQRGPRVHDLRHTFAVSRLLEWYRQGTNLNAKLPLLSTYLGHSTITGTEIYLHATAQLLERVGRRFHNHFAVPVCRRAARHAKH